MEKHISIIYTTFGMLFFFSTPSGAASTSVDAAVIFKILPDSVAENALASTDSLTTVALGTPIKLTASLDTTNTGNGYEFRKFVSD